MPTFNQDSQPLSGSILGAILQPCQVDRTRPPASASVSGSIGPSCWPPPPVGARPTCASSGSVARGDDNHDSDVDFEASRSLVDVAGLILDLQEILGVPVDVIEASTLRPDDRDILADVVALESA